MKKFLTLFILLILTKTTFACDICGCGIGNSYIGILPRFNENMIGLRYRFQQFNHQDNPQSFNGNSKVLHDVYHTSEFWLRHIPKNNRMQIFGVIPYRVNVRTDSDKKESISGIGDAFLMGNYILINTADSLHVPLKLTLQAGAGLKLPTGKYQQRNANKLMYPLGFQTGTGAWAYQINTIVTFRYKKVGINIEFQYIINTTNELMYKLGNRINIGTSLFFWKKFGFNSLLLSGGFLFEHLKADKEYNYVVNQTSGKRLLLNLNTDIYIKNYSFGFNISHPLINKVYNKPMLNNQIQLSLNRFF
ncbi:MAG: hypothetical protein ACK4K9_02290 [Bacteroidia bacterium]